MPLNRTPPRQGPGGPGPNRNKAPSGRSRWDDGAGPAGPSRPGGRRISNPKAQPQGSKPPWIGSDDKPPEHDDGRNPFGPSAGVYDQPGRGAPVYGGGRERQYGEPSSDGVKMYRCKQCKVKMRADEAAEHHRERGPCELVRCGACRAPILHGALGEHRKTCVAGGGPAVQGAADYKRAPGDGGAGRYTPSSNEDVGGGGRGARERVSGGGLPDRVGHRGDPGSRPRTQENDLGGTMNLQQCYVGDRVLAGGKPGEAMFVGKVEGIPGNAVGVRLDSPSAGSGICDGKVNGCRYFRCKDGYGIFLPQGQVRPLLSTPPHPNGGSGTDGDGLGGGPASHFGPRAAAPRKSPSQQRNEKWETELVRLVGVPSVKERIYNMRNSLEVNEKRVNAGGRGEKHAHICISGNPGSGRSTVAKLIGQMLADHDTTRMQRRNGCHMPSRQDLYHPHSTSRTAELLQEVMKKADRGVLVVDDLTTLVCDRDREGGGVTSNGKEFLEQLATEVEKAGREGPGVILVTTADTSLMAQVARACPNLRTMLTCNLELTDLEGSELCELVEKFADKRGFTFADGLRTSKNFQRHIGTAALRADKEHRNAHLARNHLEEAVVRQTERVHMMGTISKGSLMMLVEADLVPDRGNEGGAAGNADGSSVQEKVDAALDSLEKVVGLERVKDFVKSLRAQLTLDRERRDAGLPPIGQGALHMVFSGNPGTGKTTVARIIAELFAALGVLRKGQLVEADRGTLVAGYAGQTAIKTREVVETALGGLLFVDEAYALVNGERDSFGREALDTLLKMMEDNRDDLIVIFAGYEKEMKTLMTANSGLSSRFPTWLVFDDYTAPQLMQIATSMMKQSQMKLMPEAQELLGIAFEKMYQLIIKPADEKPSEGEAAEDSSTRPSNGRAVRNLLEQVQRCQALRLAEVKGTKTREDLITITAEDITPVCKAMGLT
ncbi:hypothetical protein CYMTET_38796 [Cymbomonas tetramitiformis]|uniref:CAP-Gly domain-containing protein n=1 Tax=Cymbomonas tetramitiformis TaxID=36881 RepID=A0AAE0F543_9CHLO|nr:hypothetical protein CYMTET_38796 [Cymbomonas tetramitiformis]